MTVIVPDPTNISNSEIVEELSREQHIEQLGNDNPEYDNSKVAIAAIEAERDVTIAALAAESEASRQTAHSEIVEQVIEPVKSEIEICREEIANLTKRLEAMEVKDMLIPPVQAQELAEEIVTEIVETLTEPASDLTPQSTVTPTTETMTEALEESVEEKPEAVETEARRRYIAI